MFVFFLAVLACHSSFHQDEPSTSAMVEEALVLAEENLDALENRDEAEPLQDGLSIEQSPIQDPGKDMTMELQESLQVRDAGKATKLQAKPKVLGKKPTADTLAASSPAKAGKKNLVRKPLKRPASLKASATKKQQTKEVTKSSDVQTKPKTSKDGGNKKPSNPKTSKSTSKKQKKEPKMTRECVYSRAYHKAKRTLARNFFPNIHGKR